MKEYERLKLMTIDAGANKTVYNSYFTFHKRMNELLDDIEKRVKKGKNKEVKYLTNIFWVPNHGKLGLTVLNKQKNISIKTEQKKMDDITECHFFFADFDLKDASGNHFIGQQLTDEKSNLYNKLLQMPLEPDYIVESRNGFHIYYAIPKNDWTMNTDTWKHIEICFLDYLNAHISSDVDFNVASANHVMRFPFSYHQKSGNTDLFSVYIIHARNEIQKLQELEEGIYKACSHAFSLETFKEAFEIPEHRTIVNTPKVTTTQPVQNNTYNSYPAIDAICNDNPNAPCFNCLKTKYRGVYNSEDKAKTFIYSVDLREPLGLLGQKINAAMSSLFYEDKHPSDFFTIYNGSISYACRKDGKEAKKEVPIFYNNIFSIVARAKYGVKDLTDDEWADAYQFVYDMFGIKILRNYSMAEVVENNLKVYHKACELYAELQKNHYLRTLKTYYEVILQLFQEFQETYKVPVRDLYHDLGNDYFAKQVYQRTGKKINQKWPILLLMESLGLIRETKSIYTPHEGKSAVKCFQLVVLRDSDVEKLFEKAYTIKKACGKSNPIEGFSKKKFNAANVNLDTIRTEIETIKQEKEENEIRRAFINREKMKHNMNWHRINKM